LSLLAAISSIASASVMRRLSLNRLGAGQKSGQNIRKLVADNNS
jgi:hypothetical protein